VGEVENLLIEYTSESVHFLSLEEGRPGSLKNLMLVQKHCYDILGLDFKRGHGFSEHWTYLELQENSSAHAGVDIHKHSTVVLGNCDGDIVLTCKEERDQIEIFTKSFISEYKRERSVYLNRKDEFYSSDDSDDSEQDPRPTPKPGFNFTTIGPGLSSRTWYWRKSPTWICLDKQNKVMQRRLQRWNYENCLIRFHMQASKRKSV
jgi:hypothetical protein